MHFMGMSRSGNFPKKVVFVKKYKNKSINFNFLRLFSDRNMAIKCVKMHRFDPRFHDMKATGLPFHMVKARLKSVHFSALYDNVLIR